MTSLVLVAALTTAVGFSWSDVKVGGGGEIGLAFRGFTPDDDRTTQDLNFAVASRLEAKFKLKPVALRLRGFVRYDALDQDRSAIYAEDAFVEVKKSWFRLRAGYQLFNWSATEVFHPADVMNARDWDAAARQVGKLGEPAVSLRAKMPWATLELYYRPLLVRSIFPSNDSRNRVGPPSVLGTPVVSGWSRTVGESQFTYWQWGARMTGTFGGADLAVQVLQHVDRASPVLVMPDVALLQSGVPPRLLYQTATQLAATSVYVIADVTLKIEAAYQWFVRPHGGRVHVPHGPHGQTFVLPERDHASIAAGLEYGLSHGRHGTSTFLLEGQVVLGLEGPGVLEPLFQRDVMFAYRFTFDDVAETQVFASIILDVARPQEFIVDASIQRRFFETWRVSAGIRVVRIPPRNSAVPEGFEHMNDAHQGYLELKRFF